MSISAVKSKVLMVSVLSYHFSQDTDHLMIASVDFNGIEQLRCSAYQSP